MKKRLDIATTPLVEDLFFRDWRKNDATPATKKAEKRKQIGGPIVEWVKYPNCMDGNHFRFARVGDVFINQGDNILLPSEDRDGLAQIAYIAYMYNDPHDNDKMCHAHFYCRGTDTILGEKSDPRELFLVDHCEDIPISKIIGKAKVHQKEYSKNWQLSGGIGGACINDMDDGKNYYFSKRYDYNNSRFVDFIDNHKSKCVSCAWQKEEEQQEIATIQFYEASMGKSFVKWKGEKYFVGTGVFIDYERVITVKKTNVEEENTVPESYFTLEKISNDKVWMSPLDREALYPEKHRNAKKTLDYHCQPYTVGIIEKIHKNKTISVREFYRVEDVGEKKYGNPYLVYWTNKIYTINGLSKWKSVVKGKCYVSNREHIIDEYQWIKEGPFRFYFDSQYDPDTGEFKKLPSIAKNISSGLRTTTNIYNTETAPLWPELTTKLASLDIYAGCGGLSDGLQRAGLIETKWAIENDHSAAKAFKMNNPRVLMQEANCNDILYLLLKEAGAGIGMPLKGEVDFIIGGPPCQGYSVINRFKSAESAKCNNSQINTYLGFIDYYRPKYFIFENVRNFVSFEGTDYFKLTLKCLLEIGYQISFGVLQAGNYGLPQSRRRFFIIGAAPGLMLPKLPEPTHCFGHFKKNIETIKVDNLKYDIGDSAIGYLGSLPYRHVTVRDAIEDLPYTDYDMMTTKMPYEERQNLSFYAKYLREYCNKSHLITDHECDDVPSIVKKRIELIPPGGNWTDLPNAGITLDDGTITDILQYNYRNGIGPPRGTCACAEDKPCNRTVKYSKSTTIIPWSISHTADRNNNFRNVYGRLEWDGYFETITTNPEPTSIQGRVLHPEQDRLLTVREYARAQGFHDEFIFTDSASKRYRQIGNAVPPILAMAIGREFVKTILRDNK